MLLEHARRRRASTPTLYMCVHYIPSLCVAVCIAAGTPAATVQEHIHTSYRVMSGTSTRKVEAAERHTMLCESNPPAPGCLRPQMSEGRVVAVGPGRRSLNGDIIPVAVKEGDTVLLPEYGGTTVKLDSGNECAIFTPVVVCMCCCLSEAASCCF